MKFLYMTDPHYRVSEAKWRKDDIIESQKAEMEEIRSLAIIHKVDAILCGGDFLHTYSPSYQVINMLLEWGKTLPCLLYITPGNHDLSAFNIDSLSYSGLGTLFSSDVFRRIGPEDLVWENEKVIVRGIHAYLDPKKGNYMFEEEYKDYYRIIVSHNYLTKVPQIFDHYLTKDVVTNASVVLSGHLHQGFYDMRGFTHFINPSSISRWNINETHSPQVVILDTKEGTFKNVQLKSSKPANEIFDLESARELKNNEMNLQNFIDSLNNTNFDSIDLEQVILLEGKKQDILKESIDLALEKVAYAKEVLK